MTQPVRTEHAGNRRRLVATPEHRRLQVHRDRPHLQLLLRQEPAEAKAVDQRHGLPIPGKPRDQVVLLLQDRTQRPEYMGKCLPRFPECRVPDRRLVILFGSQRKKLDAVRNHRVLEMGICGERHPMPATPQFQRQPKKWKHVPRAAESRNDEMHGGHSSGRRAENAITAAV